jgi:hypothetical protein
VENIVIVLQYKINEKGVLELNIIENYSTTIVTIYHNVVRDYERGLERIDEIHDELQDIFHEIELSTNRNLYDGYLFYKRIKELRIERRRLKEETELMKDTYEYFKGQQGQAFKTKMQQLQSNAAKLRKTQECRTYTPRQRNDLTIEGMTSSEQKSFEEMMKDFKETKVSFKNGKLRK